MSTLLIAAGIVAGIVIGILQVCLMFKHRAREVKTEQQKT